MFSLALKLLLRKIDRTAITILMLVPVIALLVGSNLLIAGYVSEAQSRVGVINPTGDYVAYNTGANDISASILNYSSFLQINSSKGISSAVSYLEQNGKVIDSSGSYPVTIVGLDLNAFVKVKHPQIIGMRPSLVNETGIGSILANILHVAVGDRVQIELFSITKNFTINFILNSSSQYDSMMVLPVSTVWNLWPQVNQKISYVEFVSSTPLQEISLSGLQITKENNLELVITSFAAQTDLLISLWTYLLLGLTIPLAVVASFRIVTGTTLEFRVLRSLGATISTAKRLLAFEHLLISAVSVILGVSAGIVATNLFGSLLLPLLGVPFSPALNISQILLIGLGAMAIISVAGIVTILGVRAIRMGTY